MNSVIRAQTWFLSYNKADKAIARLIGAHLLAQQVSVWLDEWQIGPGDSIVHEVTTGFERATGVLVLWSRNAARSRWVKRELSAAVARMLKRGGRRFRIVPVLLDQTPVPALIRDLLAIRWMDNKATALESILEAVGKKGIGRRGILMGLNDLLAVMGVQSLHQVVPVVACPKCGSEELEDYVVTDYNDDRQYACTKCRKCDWNDGSEV